MSITGALGATLWMNQPALGTITDTEPEFWEKGSYTVMGFVENFGEFGKMFDLVTFQPVVDGRTYKLKGGYNSGTIALVVGQDLADAAQGALADAADDPTQNHYAFRIELNDNQNSYGGGTIYYFLAIVMSFRTSINSVNNVVRANANLEVDGEIFRLPPAILFDFFSTGGSLSHYNLYKGTDANAFLPSIDTGQLLLQTGNTNTGFAVDGSEAVGNVALVFSLAAGPTFFTARFKIEGGTLVAAAFIGITDNPSSLEIALEAPAGTLVSNASNAVGFLFDHGYGAGSNFRLVGVNNDVDETVQDSGVAPVLNTYLELSISITTSGTATFFIDGVQVGVAMTTCCQVGVNLYPTVAVTTRNTTIKTARVDRMYLRNSP